MPNESSPEPGENLRRERRRRRPAGLTREQRRLLDATRRPEPEVVSDAASGEAFEEQPEASSETGAPATEEILDSQEDVYQEPAADEPVEAVERFPEEPTEQLPPPPIAPIFAQPAPRPRPFPAGSSVTAPAARSSHGLELQRAILIIGTLVLLALAFFFGRSFERLKYMIFSHDHPATEKATDKVPGVSAEDLVRQALLDDRAGHWQEAAERLFYAKQKDLRYRGLLLRMGQIFYAHDDLQSADKSFERAIAFNEDVAQAWKYRGLIAARRKDYPAATHDFEEATRASPLEADNYFYWAEVLRIDLQPRPAIAHYQEASLRASDQQDAVVCDFKARLARMEAAESSQVEDELEAKQAAGPLSTDWLMTAAALRLREGKIEAAAQFTAQAHDGKSPGLFAACANDQTFRDAAKAHPELEPTLRHHGPEMTFPRR